MTPADRALAKRYPELPGLAALLEPAALAGLTAAWGAGYRIERLRLKPGASVTAVMRPRGGDDAGTPQPWLLARGLATELWETKREKDIRAAEKAWGRVARAGAGTEQQGPAVVTDDAHRVLLTPAIGDRRLTGLDRLLPDTGLPVPLRQVFGRDTGAAGLRRDLPGDLDRSGTVRTLSHNPARRFVGHWRGIDGDGPGWIVRLQAHRPREVTEFVPGRPWRSGDPLPDITESTGTRARFDSERGAAWQRPDIAEALDAAACGLAALDPAELGWTERAARLAADLSAALVDTPCTPAHGDFSADQLVVTAGGEIRVLDWDRAGLWPLGWDAATWLVTRALARSIERFTDGRSEGAAEPEGCTDEPPLDGSPPPPRVVAAAALLRAPEPFRRRYPGWVDHTENLVAFAERCVAAGDTHTTPSGGM